MNKKWLLLFPALALALAGCNQGGKSTPTSSSEQETVKEVKLDIESTSIEVRQTLQLSANVTPVTLSDRTVTWSSNNEAVATVNTSGQVLGVTPGAAKIRATSNFDNTKYAECDVTVTKHYVAFEQLSADTENSYKFSCLQENVGENGTRYYFTGDVGTDTRGVTSASLAEAASVKLEAAEGSGKYHVSVTKPGSNEKKYFEMDDSHHYAIVDTPTAGREWSWNEKAKTVARTIGSTTYFPGTYNSFTTISGCDIAQLSGDFVFRFVEMVEEADPTSIAITEDSVTIRPYESAKLSIVIEPKGAVEAALTWNVTMADGSESDGKVIAEDGLVTVAGDAVKDTEYKVKCTWGNLAGDTVVIKVGEKLNYGTAEAPLTPTEAKATIDASKGKVTATDLYVKGFVTASGSYSTEYNNFGDIDIGDGITTFKGYRLKDGSTDGSFATTYAEANSLKGKTVTMCGVGKVYNNTYETDGGKTSKLLKVEDIVITPTAVVLNPADDFELEVNSSADLTASLSPFGATGEIEFSIKMEDGSDSDGKLTYANGKVTAAEDATVGNVYVVTAALKGSELKASVKVTIKAAAVDGTKVEFSAESMIEDPTADYTGGSVKFTSKAIDEVITLTVSGSDGNTGKIYKSNDYGFQIRCYNSGSASFKATAASGYKIVSAVANLCHGSSWWNKPANTQMTISTDGSSAELKTADFGSGENFAVYTVTIIYQEA